MVASKFKLLAETSAPVCVNEAFHALLTASSPGNLKVSDQPLMLVLPLLLIVTLAVNARPVGRGIADHAAGAGAGRGVRVFNPVRPDQDRASGTASAGHTDRQRDCQADSDDGDRDDQQLPVRYESS